jgi:hypothetical protein
MKSEEWIQDILAKVVNILINPIDNTGIKIINVCNVFGSGQPWLQTYNGSLVFNQLRGPINFDKISSDSKILTIWNPEYIQALKLFLQLTIS